MTTSSIVWRGIISIILWLTYGLLNNLVYPATTLVVGGLAGKQFDNDDSSYLISTYGMNFFGHVGWPFWLFLLVMLMVWWKPLRAAFTALVIGAAAIVLAIQLVSQLAIQPASAYYNKTDWPELHFILPNESAFWIPDAGANKDSQTQFMSEAYLAENKIAAKRFQIPHVKLTGSSYGFDFYIPAGRLIIVDRAPYAREWTKSATRGTDGGDQALECQSAEGLDVTIEIAISAAVFEQDAAKFLYRFGVKAPTGNREDPEVKFTSIFHGKSLTEVMDTVIHGKIQSLMCKFFSARTLDNVNKEADKIMEESEKEVRKYLIEQFGITLDFIGYAGTFGFSPIVQKSLDDRFSAEKIAPVLTTLQAQAELRVKEGLGDGLSKHGLPKNLVAIPSNLLDLTQMFAGSAKAAAAKSATPAPAQ